MGLDRAVPRRPERGLITLEWLLIVAAIAGIAGTSVLIVQRVVDDATDVPPDPVTRMIDADIAAAHIAAQAQTAFEASPAGGTPGGDPYVDSDFMGQCSDLATSFNDVVAAAGSAWTTPNVGPDTNADTDDDVRARCVLTPQSGLGR